MLCCIVLCLFLLLAQKAGEELTIDYRTLPEVFGTAQDDVVLDFSDPARAFGLHA